MVPLPKAQPPVTYGSNRSGAAKPRRPRTVPNQSSLSVSVPVLWAWVRRRYRRAGGAWKPKRAVALLPRTLDIGFDAKHDAVNLIVVTDLAATDHTIRIDCGRVSGWVGDVLVPPAVADVASDVEARPTPWRDDWCLRVNRRRRGSAAANAAAVNATLELRTATVAAMCR
jgi:hypothetical protein